LNLLAGRKIQSPVSEGRAMELLVSELSVKEAGYSSPQEAVGKGFRRKWS